MSDAVAVSLLVKSSHERLFFAASSVLHNQSRRISQNTQRGWHRRLKCTEYMSERDFE